MYAARPSHPESDRQAAQRRTYFTQTLLPDYIEENGLAWDVVYDSRGALREPHDGEIFGVGTLEVRNYLAEFSRAAARRCRTQPSEKLRPAARAGNFGAVLFIEKEGFDSLLKVAQIAERIRRCDHVYQGNVSVVAARELADEMCHEHNIPLLLLHDFDKAGFSIAGTLQRDTRRYEFQNSITTIDLGLSLEDVRAMSLESEHQLHPKGKRRR